MIPNDTINILSYSFITAFGITFFLIPTIIAVANAKHLFDVPGARNSHTKAVPTLGGLAIFAAMVFSITFWTSFSKCVHLQYLIASMTVIASIGIKDDIIGLSAFKKSIGMVVAAMIIVIWGDVRISGMFGIFGIGEVPYIISVLFSIFTILVIINAWNLIDGINGLAGSLGIISALTFGTWYFMVEDYQHAIIAYSLVGALLAFLRYNVSPAKIFMGDTGSLFLGLMMAVFAIEFIELNGNGFSGDLDIRNSDFRIKASPIVAIGIFFIPLFDLLRVFTFRILRGRSPFKPDKTHMHHILLKLGLSHMQSTAIISFAAIFLIFLTFLLKDNGTYITGGILLFVSASLSYIPYHIYKKRKKKALIK
ncbi:MAG: undecaprenyl/decaprenyl-phosphate alpha-N-acetylglucosaminyl 1-phosphate transferase [Bacteroidales bacterium]|nr:undecaprenyl/decaprenyl-phosphate alpha-N-acetylglucosaminyl 1-phosphate transferase [Bacteroidales bacterium]